MLLPGQKCPVRHPGVLMEPRAAAPLPMLLSWRKPPDCDRAWLTRNSPVLLRGSLPRRSAGGRRESAGKPWTEISPKSVCPVTPLHGLKRTRDGNSISSGEPAYKYTCILSVTKLPAVWMKVFWHTPWKSQEARDPVMGYLWQVGTCHFIQLRNSWQKSLLRIIVSSLDINFLHNQQCAWIQEQNSFDDS